MKSEDFTAGSEEQTQALVSILETKCPEIVPTGKLPTRETLSAIIPLLDTERSWSIRRLIHFLSPPTIARGISTGLRNGLKNSATGFLAQYHAGPASQLSLTTSHIQRFKINFDKISAEIFNLISESHTSNLIPEKLGQTIVAISGDMNIFLAPFKNEDDFFIGDDQRRFEELFREFYACCNALIDTCNLNKSKIDVIDLKNLLASIHTIKDDIYYAGQPILISATWRKDLKFIRTALGLPEISIEQRDAHGETALGLACRLGHAEIACFLYDKGANIDQAASKKESALVSAATNQQHTVITKLLAKRSKRYGSSGMSRNATNAIGRNALHYLYQNHAFETAITWLDSIISSFSTFRGYNYSEIIKYTSITDNKGNTPLHLLFQKQVPGHTFSLHLLKLKSRHKRLNLSRIFNWNVVNTAGHTVLDSAISSGNDSVLIQTLWESGARSSQDKSLIDCQNQTLRNVERTTLK